MVLILENDKTTVAEESGNAMNLSSGIRRNHNFLSAPGTISMLRLEWILTNLSVEAT